MGKNILFITESYHVAPSPNGACVERIANELVVRGDSVHVLALKNETARGSSAEGGVKVDRVGTHLEWAIKYSRFLPRLFKSLLTRLVLLFKRVLIPWHPLRSPMVLSSLYRKAVKIVKREGIDTVVGVYRDFETAWAALKLKKKFPHIKVIIYTLDAISGGVCSNKAVSEEKHKRLTRRRELQMLDVCDGLCVMNSHRQVFLAPEFDEYREKIHYFDVPSLMVNDFDYSKASDGTMRFVFTGMLSETNADPSPFLEAFGRMRDMGHNAALDIYGGVSAGIMRALEESGEYGSAVKFHGRVDAADLNNIRRGADALLNFGNDHFCGIPCKIFEYMSTGKRIISFYKIENDASIPYLMRYPGALILSAFGDAHENARRIIDFLTSTPDIAVDKKYVYGEFRSNTPFEISDFIESL